MLKDKRLKNECTGCFACYNICPVKAISMPLDNEGFFYPKINKNKCIKCDLCKKVCPILNKTKNTNIKPRGVYSAWSLNKEIILNSSSGGIFSELANLILSKGGVVFGAEYINAGVRHVWVESKKDLMRLRKSKYLPSYIGNSYQKVAYFLNKSRNVLFSGTPCQISGLYNYLNVKKISKKKLITCEIICHGVPSLKIFNDYLNSKKIDKEKEFNFRDKQFGWEFVSTSYYTNKRKKIMPAHLNSFFVGFSKNSILRKSCYKCKFAVIPRFADITLGDYWGAPKKTSNFWGTSAVIINSQKGVELFNGILENISYKKITLNQVSLKNPRVDCSNYSEKMLDERLNFFREYNSKGFNFVEKKYLKPSKHMYLDLVKKGAGFIFQKLFS
jgi:coenzyme F420-reducing hydrogenase beta subunit